MTTETVEILDCRNVVEASFPSTLILVHRLPVSLVNTGVCFHDGFPFEHTGSDIEFRGTVFCSLACAVACQSLSDESCITGDDEAELFFKYSATTDIPLAQVAPPRRELAVFGGGNYTLAKFRNNNRLVVEPVGAHCLYDCHPITGDIVTYPRFFEGSTFCSYNCMLSFVLEDSSIGSIAETEIRNRVRYNLIPAAPRILLKKFGGYWEIKKFREDFADTYYKILPERTLVSAATQLIPLGENVASYRSHVEIHKFFALQTKPGEYAVETTKQVPTNRQADRPAAEKAKTKSLGKVSKKKAAFGKQRQEVQTGGTCVVKISSGSGKILNSTKCNQPQPICSGKLPFKKK